MDKRMRRGGNRVTLSDVARHAGVSPMTVSRTLNAPDQVSQDLRDQVLKSVEALGYIQNRLAGALASDRSGVIAIVIPSLANNVFIAMTDALHRHLLDKGFQPLITVTDYSFEKEEMAIGNILSWKPDGLVLVGVDHAPHLRRLIEGAGLPVVEAVQLGPAIDMNVGIDHVAAGRLMGDYLVAQGYETIWMVGQRLEADRRVGQRFEGCRAALAAAGLRTDLVRHMPLKDNLAFGAETLAMVAAEPGAHRAIFYGNDLMAIGALQAARQAGLSIPGDIGIAGFNGIDLASYVTPTLTTVSVPYVEMARIAADLLVSQILEGGTGRRVVALAPTLVRGQSA